MTTSGLWKSADGHGPAEVHRNTYRLFCILCGVLNPTFGLVYRFTNPEAVDPLWARFAFAVIPLLLLSLSYMYEWAWRRFILLVQAYFYLLIVYIVGLTALSRFHPNYTLGLVFTITAVGVAFSLGQGRHVAPLRWYLAFAVSLTIPAALFSAPPQISIIILSICAFNTAVVIYVAANAKMKAEESVAASEQRYHILMNAASDAIFIADPGTGLLIDANEKAQELIGRSLEDIRQMRTAELFPLQSRRHYQSLFEGLVFEKKALQEDLFLAHLSGETIPVDVSASLVDVGGRKFIQGIFRRHRYEQQLIEAKERAEELLHLKSSLLNNMSHELRTPLTSILGYAEMMADDSATDSRECADVIITSARRLQDTLNSILGLAQLESGGAHLDLKPIDVAACVGESVSLLHGLADKKGIRLNTVLHTPGAMALADEVCLSRIVNNLVGNAIKFTEQGSVTVEVKADASNVHLCITDTGIGISSGFLPHLFQEFRQESTGLARSYEGSGLGLAITKRLVELLGGIIFAESEKGEGSTFSVILPRVAMPEQPAPVTTDSGKRAASGRTSHVLVVEDNADTRKLLAQRLEAFFTVDSAPDPSGALRLASHGHYDAFFLDINLGSTRDGLDVLRAIRQMGAYARTPVVALTAYAMPGDRERFLSAGFDFYLSKPFTKAQLLEVAGNVARVSSRLPLRKRRKLPEAVDIQAPA